ncbi:coiled-coil-helix-coiled-coil-helix domain containing 3a isoform X1 [Trichomycterus rosablanca]|uniref:coiled-coil-helix-coiled-coil-helix domain containing 3a isoform X1 n=1 Tax=Trichomycterus rosablanca TaxID=2290929 RepID=UPI002F35DE41
MGANNSTRRVSFESDENDNITVVKGVRLSENVINRMREPGPPQAKPEPPPTRVPSRSPFDPSATQSPVKTHTEPVASPTLANDASSLEITAPCSPADASALEEPVTPPVDDLELRRRITEEVQKGIQEERTRTQQEIHQWLETERSRVQVKAHADAQAHVKDELNRILASEREAAQDSVQQALLRERVTAEEERLRAQLYAKRLEAKDKQLKNQDAFYREQLRNMEERSTQFFKVTNENYHKAADEVNAKFKRYEISPVCADLQSQILNCYKENSGTTLLCSNLASLYMQCVNNAKQNKLRTGG